MSYIKKPQNIFNSKSYWIISILASAIVFSSMFGFLLAYKFALAMSTALISVYFSFAVSDFMNRKKQKFPLLKSEKKMKKTAPEKAKEKLNKLLKGRFS